MLFEEEDDDDRNRLRPSGVDSGMVECSGLESRSELALASEPAPSTSLPINSALQSDRAEVGSITRSGTVIVGPAKEGTPAGAIWAVKISSESS